MNTVFNGKYYKRSVDEYSVSQVLGHSYTRTVGVTDITDPRSGWYRRVSEFIDK